MQKRTSGAVALLVAAACLAGFAAAPAGAQEAARTEGADVFFIVDTSGSMRRLDPGDMRTTFGQILSDLVLSRGGDRVSVVRLGGKLESGEYDPIVLPLTTIPRVPAAGETTPDMILEISRERDEALETVKKALAEKQEGFGRGSDFNTAFESGVFKQRSDRPAVVIVISDGNMEVIEGDRAPDVYVREAKEQEGVPLRDRINAAAMERFRSSILPALANPHPLLKTYVIPVGVGSTEDEGRYVLKDLVSAPGVGRIIPLRDSLVDAVALALRAPAGVDAPPWNAVPVQALEGHTVPPESESTLELRIPVEAVETRILVLGGTPDYAVGLAGVGGQNLGDEEGVHIFGGLSHHRVVAVSRRDVPNHTLVLTNHSAEEAVFNMVVFCSFDLQTHLAIQAGAEGLAGGKPLPLEVGLKDRATGLPVAEPWLLDRLVAVVRLMDASGEVVEKRFPFAGGASAVLRREIPVDPRTPAGTFLVSASCVIIGDDATAWLRIPPAEQRTQLKPGAPLILAEFESGRVYLGHDAVLRGEMGSGYPPAGRILVVLEHAPATGQERRDLEATLSWDAAAAAYLGVVRFDRPGRYQIRAEETAERSIVRGLRGGVDVAPRSIALVSESGAPLQNVHFSPAEGSKGAYADLTFFVDAGLLPGERGVLTFSARRHESSPGAILELGTGTSFDLSGDNPRAKVTLRLSAEEGTAPGGEVGTLEIQGTLGGDVVQRRAPVTAVARTLPEKKWTDVFRRREVLVAAIALVALLLVGGLYLGTMPRFRQQHLLHERGDGGWDDGALLSEMRAGWDPRNAFGTPEVKRALHFRLHGLRGLGSSHVAARPMKPFIQFFKNGALESGWAVLQHGDRIQLRGARYAHLYRYFEQPLAPEEYRALEPEGVPAAAGAVTEEPQQELVIEIPLDGPDMGFAAEPAVEEEEPFVPPAAAHGFQDEEEGGEGALETVVEEVPVGGGAQAALAELETMFEQAPAGPAKEGGFGGTDKSLSFTDIFGDEEGPDLQTVREDALADEGPEYQDQDTIFEQFFGRDEAVAEEEEEEPVELAPLEDEFKEGTDILPETEIAPEGDGTEIMGEGLLADAFKIDPEGIFSDGDITKLLEEAELGDGEILIDVPLDEDSQDREQALEEIFSVSSEGEEEELNPELTETQEVLAEGEDGVNLFEAEAGDGTEIIDEEEEGILSSGDGTEIVTEWTPPEGEVEEELVMDGEPEEDPNASGILTSMFTQEEEEEEEGEPDEGLSEIRSEIEEDEEDEE